MNRRTIWAVVGVLAFITGAYGVNTRVSSLSAASSVGGTDLLYDVQTGGVGGVKATALQLATRSGLINGKTGIPSSYYVTNNWYTFNVLNSSSAVASTLAGSTVYCSFGFVRASVTIKALGAYVVTGVAATNAQFAIYSESAGTLTLVDKTANVATATSATAISQTVGNTTDILSPGTLYAFCTNDSGAAAFSANAGPGIISATIGSSSLQQVTNPSAVATAGLTGISWSDNLGTWASPKAISVTSNVIETGNAIVPTVVFEVN